MAQMIRRGCAPVVPRNSALHPQALTAVTTFLCALMVVALTPETIMVAMGGAVLQQCISSG